MLRAIVVGVGLLALPVAGASAAPGPLSFGAPERIDQAAGLQAPAVSSLSCVSVRLCYGVDTAGDVVRFSGAIATGGGQTLSGADPGVAFLGVSCPSARLCIGIDAHGRVLSTRTPGVGGAWKAVQIGDAADPPELTGITCPSTRLCVLVNGSEFSIDVSTDPTGDARTWHTRGDNEGGGNIPLEVACPSARVCVASNGSVGFEDAAPGRAGTIACASTRACVIVGRTGGGLLVRWTTNLRHGWHTATLSSALKPRSLACPLAHQCLIGGPSGQVTRLTLPDAAGQPRLASVNVGAASVTIGSLACPSAKLCLAGDSAGETFATARPATDRGWRLVHTIANPAALLAVTCPSTTECVASDNAGGVLTAPGPAGPWTRQVVDSGHAIPSIACPTANQCFAGDSAGQLLVSGTSGPSGVWQTSSITGAGSVQSLTCPSAALCLAAYTRGTDGDGVTASQNPTDTDPVWNPINVDGDDEEDYDDPFVACAAVDGCASAFFEIDTDASSEYITLSTTIEPTSSDESSWYPTQPSAGTGLPTAISCGAAACVATSNTGQVDVGTIGSTRPFVATAIDPGNTLTGVDCTADGRCVTVDAAGGVFSSDDPAAGASTWQRIATLPGGGQDAVACPTSGSCVAVDRQGRAAVGSAAG